MSVKQQAFPIVSFQRAFANLESINRHDRNPMVMNNCTGNYKAMENLMTVKLKPKNKHNFS